MWRAFLNGLTDAECIYESSICLKNKFVRLGAYKVSNLNMNPVHPVTIHSELKRPGYADMKNFFS